MIFWTCEPGTPPEAAERATHIYRQPSHTENLLPGIPPAYGTLTLNQSQDILYFAMRQEEYLTVSWQKNKKRMKFQESHMSMDKEGNTGKINHSVYGHFITLLS